MTFPDVISYKSFYLKKLTENDVSQKYLDWVCDHEVTEFLEIRFNHFTLDELRAYVRSFENDTTKFLFGVFAKKDNTHIGNVTINTIDYHHGTFSIGYLIGDKHYWGTSAGMEVCLMALKFGFEELKLRKFFGGVYANHVKSRFVLKRIGCVEEARLVEKCMYKDKPVDGIIYTLTSEQWAETKRKYQV